MTAEPLTDAELANIKADEFAPYRSNPERFRSLLATIDAQEKVIEAARRSTRTGNWWEVSDALAAYNRDSKDAGNE